MDIFYFERSQKVRNLRVKSSMYAKETIYKGHLIDLHGNNIGIQRYC